MSAVIVRGTTPAKPATPKSRPKRSRIAQPLILSLGILTFLASASYVVAAATATGSARPQDWLGVNWTVVGDHSSTCIQQQGAGALGCLLTASSRPLPSPAPAAAATPQSQPYYAVTVITDSPATPAARPTARHSAAPRATAMPSPAGATPTPFQPRPVPTHQPGDD